MPRRRRAAQYDKTLVLGDLVGYGPDPNAVIDRLRDSAARRNRPRESRQGGVRPRARRTASTPSPRTRRAGRWMR